MRDREDVSSICGMIDTDQEILLYGPDCTCPQYRRFAYHLVEEANCAKKLGGVPAFPKAVVGLYRWCMICIVYAEPMSDRQREPNHYQSSAVLTICSTSEITIKLCAQYSKICCRSIPRPRERYTPAIPARFSSLNVSEGCIVDLPLAFLDSHP